MIASAYPRPSLGGTSRPVTPWWMLSRKPPASAAITPTPEDIASSATSPQVSVWEGITHRSALAYSVARCCRGKKRSEEHTSELQSLRHLVCRLLLEKKKKTKK